jgi:putative DNA primase/helicase
MQNGWKDTTIATLSSEQRRKAAEIQRQAKAEREIQDQKDAVAKAWSQQIAVNKAKALLANAEVSEHAYLKSKQLPEILGFVTGDVLVIPLRDLNGTLTGAQLIWYHDEGVGTTEIHVEGMKPIVFRDLENEPDGFIKKFIAGTQAKGSVFRLGNRNAPATIICEGYATGLSIAEAAHLMRQDVSVLVCFSAFNTMYVSNLLKGYKRGIFADNDAAGKGEDYAKKAKVPYVMSKHEGFDANDEAVELGIFYLAENVRQLINSMQ